MNCVPSFRWTTLLYQSSTVDSKVIMLKCLAWPCTNPCTNLPVFILVSAQCTACETLQAAVLLLEWISYRQGGCHKNSSVLKILPCAKQADPVTNKLEVQHLLATPENKQRCKLHGFSA